MAATNDHPTGPVHLPAPAGRAQPPGSGDARPSARLSPPGGGDGRTAAPRPVRWLVAAGLLLTALNLRPVVTGLGPLLAEVRDGLGMSGIVTGLLTSAPALCFAVFGSAAPRLARRWGPVGVVLAGMAAVAAGLALRPLAGGTAGFLAGTAVALAGVGVGNVLMPVIVKQWFPHRIGTMTGLYSLGLALGTSGAAAVAVPLTGALGGNWRAGLGSWAVLAVSALLPWCAVLRRVRGGRTAVSSPGHSGTAPGSTRPARIRRHRAGPAAPATSAPSAAPPRITRSGTAWALAVFFGLQSAGAYITMGWLPQIFRDAGVPAATAGLLLAVTMGVGIPLAFVVPKAAARMRHQGPLVLLLGGCGFLGYAGLWLAPAGGAWAWALLLGVSNCAFPLALTLIGMRSRTGAGVARLSAFAQGVGYLIAVPGPLLIGALQQYSGGWELPLAVLVVLLAGQVTAGLLAGRDRCVEDGG